MACEYCAGPYGPATDHGFDLPDVRVRYEVKAPCDACEGDGRIHCTLNGKTHSTSWWDNGTTRTRTWEGFEVRPLTAEERKLPWAGHWTGTVGGHHHVHALSDTTFLEECGDCDGCGTVNTAGPAIYVKRTWHTCECGHGQDYKVTFRVKDADGRDLGVWFSSEGKAETWVGIEFPGATLPEDEDDGEGWLRRCEGWG